MNLLTTASGMKAVPSPSLLLEKPLWPLTTTAMAFSLSFESPLQ